jgi:glycosyltransferase involved in cell wall biosynthesis
MMAYKIGWVVDASWPYRNVMASTRIRCLDIIEFLRAQGIKTGLCRPFRRYDIVVFQKSFSEKHYEIAKRLSTAGSKIVLDVNVNYFVKVGETTQVTEQQIENLHRFLELTDIVLVSSPYLKGISEKYHPDVRYIPEHISTIGSYSPKKLSSPAKLLYCGYAVKADSVLLIEDVLRELSREYDFEFIFVCDKNPYIKLPIKTSFIKYRHKNLANILRLGDIKIAPRRLDNSYDLGHSFTKIGYPMSVGLPVVASPVPSYEGSPALLATTEEEWLHHLRLLISNPSEYYMLSQKGISFVRENFPLQKIGNMYIELFESLV